MKAPPTHGVSHACVSRATPTHVHAPGLSVQVQAPGLSVHQLTPPENMLINSQNEVKNQDTHSSALFKQMDMVNNFWPTISKQATEQFPVFADIYNQVLAFSLPNFIGTQVHVDSALKVDQWELALQNYHDRDLCKFLRFGWPLGYLADTYPTSVSDNHSSALIHEKDIQKFIQVELGHRAIIGPFDQEPFTPWTRCSPLMTRPKKDSVLRRVIVDLSFPKGFDVNSAIDTTSYLGQDISFKLPTISDLVAKLQLDGDGAYIWKADLCRAYRQLRIDPLDSPLTGIKFQFYLDRCPPFGCRSSSAACQRVSNALAYIMGQAGFFLLAYLDDYAACEPTLEKANQSYSHFIELT